MNFRDLRHVCLFLGLIACLCGSEAFGRTWTDSTGKFSVEAEFVELVDGQVALRRPDGRVVRLPLERLSEADQRHVQSLAGPAIGGPLSNANDASTREVVAEGVGLTPEQALKDAFRAAVRQVVGEVVDAETLVNDDMIVKDQVLTFSSGFIPEHTKLSESNEGGLFRITIRAVVERNKLEVRLRAANVSLKNVDGQSLFGSIVSQLESEKDASALLTAALDGFPKACLAVHVVGEPQVVRKTDINATLQFQIELKPDADAYKSFAQRLQKTLQSFATDRGEFTMSFNRESVPTLPQSEYFKNELNGRNVFSLLSRYMPKCFTPLDQNSQQSQHREKMFTIALATRVSKQGDQLGFSYFLLDSSVQSPIVQAVRQIGKGQLAVLDSRGQTLLSDQFLLSDRRETAVAFDGNLATGLWASYFLLYDRTNMNNRIDLTHECVFLIAPVFFGSAGSNGELCHKPTLRFIRDITLTLEEIKIIDKVKCEIEFN